MNSALATLDRAAGLPSIVVVGGAASLLFARSRSDAGTAAVTTGGGTAPRTNPSSSTQVAIEAIVCRVPFN